LLVKPAEFGLTMYASMKWCFIWGVCRSDVYSRRCILKIRVRM